MIRHEVGGIDLDERTEVRGHVHAVYRWNPGHSSTAGSVVLGVIVALPRVSRLLHLGSPAVDQTL